MLLDRLRRALVPGWKGNTSLGMLIARARQELKLTEELKDHLQELREAKVQETTLISLTRAAKAKEEEKSAAPGKLSTPQEDQKTEGDILAEKLEQEQRNQIQQRAKLQNFIQAFRKGQV